MISAISSSFFGITNAISRFDAAANKITAVAPVTSEPYEQNRENIEKTTSGEAFSGGMSENLSSASFYAAEESYLSGMVEMTMAKSELAAGIKVYETAVEMADELLASV